MKQPEYSQKQIDEIDASNQKELDEFYEQRSVYKDLWSFIKEEDMCIKVAKENMIFDNLSQECDTVDFFKEYTFRNLSIRSLASIFEAVMFDYFYSSCKNKSMSLKKSISHLTANTFENILYGLGVLTKDWRTFIKDIFELRNHLHLKKHISTEEENKEVIYSNVENLKNKLEEFRLFMEKEYEKIDNKQNTAKL